MFVVHDRERRAVHRRTWNFPITFYNRISLFFSNAHTYIFNSVPVVVEKLRAESSRNRFKALLCIFGSTELFQFKKFEKLRINDFFSLLFRNIYIYLLSLCIVKLVEVLMARRGSDEIEIIKLFASIMLDVWDKFQNIVRCFSEVVIESLSQCFSFKWVRTFRNKA